MGNLRTALLAWLAARSTGRRFLIRVEDLDRVKRGAADRQLADLAALGLDWDDEPMYQSRRREIYDEALADLAGRGLTYECYCTRAEIAQAASAPHAPPGAYPGTCRELSDAARERRRATRAPALRLRAGVDQYTVVDELAGRYTGQVDDVVLRRGDGVPAYNLVAVLDDAAQGVDQVLRGDDLLPSTPRQAYLATLLGIAVPGYVHVPLALNPAGQRLAKRDGAVTLADLAPLRWTPGDVVALLASSCGLSGPGERPTVGDLLASFEVTAIPRSPWIVDASALAAGPPHRPNCTDASPAT